MNIKFKYIKLFLVIVTYLLGIGNAFPIRTAYGMDGYWSSWNFSLLEVTGSMRNFVLFNGSDHPSIFLLRWKADNYTKPSKKEIKEHIKSDSWFEYTGTVEYWVSEEYPTIKDVLKKKQGSLVTNPDSGYGNSQSSGRKVKRTATAKMMCQFYKNGYIKNINLFFDNIGYGIGCDSYSSGFYLSL